MSAPASLRPVPGPAAPVRPLRARRWAPLLAVAVLAVYSFAWDAPFLFDDGQAVVNNPTIRRLWPLTDALHPPADGTTTSGRPWLNLSFAVNRALAGDGANGYRAGNVLIHLLAALVLLRLVNRTLALGPGAALPAARRELLAGAVALVWAVHPLQTETVVCIAQRSESWCALFYLLALAALAAALAREAGAARAGEPPPPAWRTRLFLGGSVACCALGLLAKEVAVTAPVVLLLYDRTFGAGSFAGAWRRRRGYYLALALTWLLPAWLLLSGGGTRGASAGFGLGVSSWSYLLKQAEALVLYLRLCVWPHPLVLDYGTAVAGSVSEVWWQGGVVLALLAATIWALVRRRTAGFLGACFFLVLAPSSSVVPLGGQTVAEHRMYLPLAAVVAAGLAGLGRLGNRRAAWLVGALAAGLAAASVARVRDYASERGIWEDTVRKVPQNARALGNLGTVLVGLNLPAEAIAPFAAAVRLTPADSVAVHNLGNALDLAGRRAEAIVHYREALRLNDANPNAHVALAVALAAEGRLDDARPHFQAALRLAPGAPRVQRSFARALLRAGRLAEAESAYREATRLDPAWSAGWAELAEILGRTGRLTEAERLLRQALQADPANPVLQGNLGTVLLAQRRPLDARPWFEAALRAEGGSALAHANLGNALFLAGDYRAAVAHYETALRLQPADASVRRRLEQARERLAAAPR